MYLVFVSHSDVTATWNEVPFTLTRIDTEQANQMFIGPTHIRPAAPDTPPTSCRPPSRL